MKKIILLIFMIGCLHNSSSAMNDSSIMKYLPEDQQKMLSEVIGAGGTIDNNPFLQKLLQDYHGKDLIPSAPPIEVDDELVKEVNSAQLQKQDNNKLANEPFSGSNNHISVVSGNNSMDVSIGDTIVNGRSSDKNGSSSNGYGSILVKFLLLSFVLGCMYKYFR